MITFETISGRLLFQTVSYLLMLPFIKSKSFRQIIYYLFYNFTHHFNKLLFHLIKSLWYLSITLLFCPKLKAYWKTTVYSLLLFSLSRSETRCSLRFSIILSSSILLVFSTGFSTVLFTALLILSHFPSFTITQCLLYCCMFWRLLR